MNTRSCLLCGFNATEKLTFSRFPAKNAKRKKWLQQCCLDLETNVSGARLCCKHFKEEDFQITRKERRLLKPDAFPSVFFNSNDAPKEKEGDYSPYNLPGNYFHSCIICGHAGNENVSFYRLPMNENTRKKWLAHFNIDSTDPRVNVQEPQICGLHFRQQSEIVSTHCRHEKELLPWDEDDSLWADFQIITAGNSAKNDGVKVMYDDCNQAEEIRSPPTVDLSSLMEEECGYTNNR